MKRVFLIVTSLATLALLGLFVTPNEIPPGPVLHTTSL
jgi:hypothetical protein